MTIWTYLRDRFFIILAYFLSSFLTLLVIDMDVLQSRLFLTRETIVYIGVLTITVLVIFLSIDYLRQWPFYREVNRPLKKTSKDRLYAFQRAITHEQKRLQKLEQQNYKAYMKKLAAYQKQQERHSFFTNEWVHSMKTPVSVIHLLIQQSSEMESIQEAHRILKSIEEENERLSHGLNMVLHTARLEKFELDVAIQPVDLVGLVRAVINEHKKAMIRSSIFPRVICPEETSKVETDEKWLRFILNQVTTNAIKYTPKGDNRKISYEISQRDGACLLSIKDEGIGIPQHDLPRIVEPFFTGENGRKGAESTGMGLFLANEVCERLGHRLTIESVQGVGTEVSILFLRNSLFHDTLKT